MSLSKQILSGVTTLIQTGFYHLKVIQYFFSKFLENTDKHSFDIYLHTDIHFGTQMVSKIICLPTKIAYHVCSLARSTRRNDELVFLVLKQAKNTDMNGTLPFIQ